MSFNKSQLGFSAFIEQSGEQTTKVIQSKSKITHLHEPEQPPGEFEKFQDKAPCQGKIESIFPKEQKLISFGQIELEVI
jgi:hypothetical protein